MDAGGDYSISIYDPFGFRIPPDERDSKALDTIKAKKDNARLIKWIRILPKLHPQAQHKARKLKTKIRKGIPDCLRGKVWPVLADLTKFRTENNYAYHEYLKQTSPYEEAIAKDVYRTYPDHQFFAVKGGQGQKSLGDILKVLSLTFKEMGYCQGLNFIAGLLAMHCNDEEAYWVMCSLLKEYNLIEFYQDPSKLKRTFYVMNELVISHYPKLSKHFKTHDIAPILYSTKWFLTLYTNCLPFGLVLRIFDVYLFENYKIMFRVALAILKIKQAALLAANDIDPIMRILNTFDEPIFHNEDAFFKVVFGINLKRGNIRRFEKRYLSLNST